MKITLGQLFDKTKLLRTADPTFKEIVRNLTPFIDYVNQGFGQIVRALSGELTFNDNLKGEIITVELLHATATRAQVKSRDILTIIPLSVESNTLYGLDRSFTDAGELQLTAYWRSTPVTTAIKCTFFVAYN
jgi:hypothetical protein